MKKTVFILLVSALLIYGFTQIFDEIIITEGGDIVFTNCALLDTREVGGSYWMDLIPDNDTERLALGTYDKPWRYLWLHTGQYLRLASQTLVDLVSDGDVEIEAGGNILLSPDQTEESQIILDIPVKNGGGEKVRCALWFCPITKTLKASPVEKMACGGFNE